jgi:hypothetical protein
MGVVMNKESDKAELENLVFPGHIATYTEYSSQIIDRDESIENYENIYHDIDDDLLDYYKSIKFRGSIYLTSHFIIAFIG